MKRFNTILLASALFGATAVFSASCKNGDGDDVVPTPDIADELVGNYLTYDTTTFVNSGSTTVTTRSGSASIAKVSATQVRLNNILGYPACNDSVVAEVSATTLVAINGTCNSAAIITRNGTNIRFTFTESDAFSGNEIRYSGRAEKQP